VSGERRPQIVTVGNRADYPMEVWGSDDVAQHLKDQAAAAGQLPPVAAPLNALPDGFGLYGDTRDEQRARAADDALRKAGVSQSGGREK
jgi:hypothetical protein